ncbi:promethin-like [Gouania willdenowi]|uniref:promethin-like n=1 Tax=Gouania willdenowi TaxID=441366 RepID=UPI0010566842|nr:promethin [Gouania willdenowi]
MQSTSTSTTSSTSSRRLNLQQLYGRGMSLLKKIQADPRVAGVMSTRVYLYLSSHPFAALSLLIFSALAAVPFGVFFSLALIITTVSVLSFVFFEGFLLVFGVLTLLFVLSGIAFFSVFATLVLGTFYVTGSSISSRLFLRRNKVNVVKEKENGMTKENPVDVKQNEGESTEEEVNY